MPCLLANVLNECDESLVQVVVTITKHVYVCCYNSMCMLFLWYVTSRLIQLGRIDTFKQAFYYRKQNIQSICVCYHPGYANRINYIFIGHI